MEKENLIEEQQRILQKYLNDEPLDYYETIVAFAVVATITFALLKKVAEVTLESEVKD